MKDAKFEMEIDSEPASKAKAACDGKWTGYYIEASQEAYDLLIAEGYYDAETNSSLAYGIKNNGFFIIKEEHKVTWSHSDIRRFEKLKPLYIVDGKLSATRYHPDEVSLRASLKAGSVFCKKEVCDCDDLYSFTVTEISNDNPNGYGTLDELREEIGMYGDATKYPDIKQKVLDATPFENSVCDVLNSIYAMLKEKNKKYGNSAFYPKRIFSSASSVEQLLVRIDDKLSRISNQNLNDDEDVIEDLIGYLVLLKIAQKKEI